MTKEEKIKEAWGVLYEKYKERISLDDGYLHIKSNKALKEVKSIFNEIQFTVGGGISIFRPRQLQGIENNNGWIKIESEDDLPKESGEYHVFNTEDVFTENFRRLSDSNRKMWLKLYTHYQPIEKPKPPIY